MNALHAWGAPGVAAFVAGITLPLPRLVSPFLIAFGTAVVVSILATPAHEVAE